MIHITETAAKQMRFLADERGLGATGGLRLVVEKGGCAGLQYEMEIARQAESDLVFQDHDACLFVPPDSLPYVDGSTIDFADGLSGAGFRILNPKASRSCGCGTSFEPSEAPSS